jgi:site-specific DNA recombinase
MNGTSKMGKIHNYYKCNNAKKKLCSKKAVQKDLIENQVVDQYRLLLTDDNIQKIANEVVALFERDQAVSDLKRLSKLIKEVERKKANVINAIAECDIDTVCKSMYEHLQVLESERESLETQIAIEQLSQVSISETEIRFFLTQLKKGNINDEKYRSTLINVFINSIYLYDDKITFIFNSSDKPVTVGKSLIEEFEASNNEFEGSFLGKLTPP